MRSRQSACKWAGMPLIHCLARNLAALLQRFTAAPHASFLSGCACSELGRTAVLPAHPQLGCRHTMSRSSLSVDVLQAEAEDLGSRAVLRLQAALGTAAAAGAERCGKEAGEGLR